MQPVGTLRLTLDPDHGDGTAELFVEAATAGFAGRSSAWFDLSQIAEFARALDAFPISPDRPPRLAGGWWGRDVRAPALEQEHVLLEVRAEGRRGVVRIVVRLASPPYAGDRGTDQHRAVLSFLAEYGMLQRFASAVSALVAGSSGEAVLTSDVAYA